MKNEEKNWETDIRLIQSDIKQINKFFAKVEDSLALMSELTTQVAVQSETSKNTVDKLEDVDKMVQEHRKEDYERTKALHQRLEEYRQSSYNDHQRSAKETKSGREAKHSEIMKEIKASHTIMMGKMTEQNDRIASLENWKYYMMGMGAVIMFILVKIVDISALFG